MTIPDTQTRLLEAYRQTGGDAERFAAAIRRDDDGVAIVGSEFRFSRRELESLHVAMNTKIGMSDTPDTMLALLIALRAAQAPVP